MSGGVGGIRAVCASKSTTASFCVRSAGRAGRRTWIGRRGSGIGVTRWACFGIGLTAADHHEDALSVREAELAMVRRLGASEEDILVVQTNLAGTYRSLGRLEDCLRTQGDVYSGTLKLYGEEHRDTLGDASNYALCLIDLQRFEEAKALIREVMPVARRVLGESDDLTLRMRLAYARALYKDAAASLNDLREAVTTLEDTVRIRRRVLGGSHPTTKGLERNLRDARAALAARETPPPPSPSGDV